MECVCFTLIVDDIVLPHGETVMEVLGGGGPQTLFGYQLVTNQKAVVGLSAGIGPDLPKRCKDWLESLGVDTSGLVPYKRPTPRAWQVFEEWGRRTQIWRGRDDPCDELYDMLRPKYDIMPPHFQRSCNYHLGIHPLHPPLRLMRQLRQAARANGGVLSIEPYTAAEEAARPDQVSILLAHCDIFSPNEAEAESIVGPGHPEELAQRLLALSPPGGADLVVVRCGPEGVLVARRRASGEPPQGQKPQQELCACAPWRKDELTTAVEAGKLEGQGAREVVEAYRVPAVADTAVVDVTGCGNAFCGAFLAALYRGGGGVSVKDGATSGYANDTGSLISASSSASGAESSASRAEFDAGSNWNQNAKQNPRPTWVQTGDLQLAGAWGCVAASFMAEERGVPMTRVVDLQDRANARLKALLPRIDRVKLQWAANRAATCQVVAAMPLERGCPRTCGPSIRPMSFVALRPSVKAGGRYVKMRF
ncbi:hypothetical protein Vretimale_7719 [Volvox reticuliferus]|uniref:Carbohydrate kinase PfkB domain-containing protein n=1 Tax=Volvox reticuliferus TaxID=1737510 RepID=A0A8J4FJ12_9CHLO|nr:hypothetical protein Vretifemale_7724 [Volvox reticuliferus]GIM02887.1 hypothetical protein Vretimale_7719 [Volvox reticuliferus]